MDRFQFAYQKRRSVDDAILYVLNNIYLHLDKPESSICLIFYNFSSAFNTIQPHIALADKLMDYNMLAATVLRVLDYLTNRRQLVKLTDKVKSGVICTNTGAPQGTVLSPCLFSVYTAHCRCSHSDCVLVKYADDMALTALITDDDDTHYRQEIDSFVQWCGRNYLDLQVGKTKEMVIDFRRKIGRPEPAQVVLRGYTVEPVETYKYLDRRPL